MNLKSNYRAGDNKESKTNKKNISEIVYARSEKMHYVRMILIENFYLRMNYLWRGINRILIMTIK
jgi:hypothetical protein